MSFRRALGPFDATMVVVGGIIGSGIFINPSFVARTLNYLPTVLAVWIIGGLVALAGARRVSSTGRFSLRLGAPGQHREPSPRNRSGRSFCS